jgi:hypothetical protein
MTIGPSDLNGNGNGAIAIAEPNGAGRSADPWPLLPGEPPPFPLDALPTDMRRWVEAVAEETQTPLDLAAIDGLGVLSAAAVGRAKVDCGAFSEELALYLVVAMPSGDRKSTVQRHAVRPLRAIERERQEASKESRRKACVRHKSLEERQRKLEKKAGDCENSAEQGEVEAELERIAEELEELKPQLTKPRLLADDATPEALAGLLATHGRLAIIEAEGPIVDNLLGRYDGKGSANLTLVCKAYDGDPHQTDRRGREGDSIERPLMAIALTTQPHVLSRVVSDEIARAQGLVSRFGFVLPESRLGDRGVDTPHVPPELHEAWERTVRRVSGLEFADTTDTTPPFVSSVSNPLKTFFNLSLSLSIQANELFLALQREQEPRLREGGDLRAMADWVNRRHGRVARVAGLLHLVEHSVDEPISAATMRSAIRIGDYLLEHARAALTGHDEGVRRQLRWLAQATHGASSVTERELHRGLFNHGKIEEAKKAAAKLVAIGALRRLPSTDASPTGGRPPSTAYAINPHLRSGAHSYSPTGDNGWGSIEAEDAPEVCRPTDEDLRALIEGMQ